MPKFLRTIILLTILGVAVYTFRNELQNGFVRLNNSLFPCSEPIYYSIGTFDKRFGISENAFQDAILKAEQIWEKPIDKDLFVYKPDGALKINLIYDYRQDATVKLKSLGLTLGNDEASYNTIKAKYISLQKDYIESRASFEDKLISFESKQKAYNEEVSYWNNRGGAPKSIYARLTDEKNSLKIESEELNRLQTEINNKADDINSLIIVLNRLIESLNLKVSLFNEIGKERGEEFSEGIYKSSSSGQEIDIYQFDDSGKLVRVLAHEFGHALGLSHLGDPKAIMYRLNQGSNEKLATTDLAALKELCRIK